MITWKPNEVKKIGIAETIRRLSNGTAVKFSNFALGNIKINTATNAIILPINSTRVNPSTPLIPITTKEPNMMVKIKIPICSVVFASPIFGKMPESNDPPPEI